MKVKYRSVEIERRAVGNDVLCTPTSDKIFPVENANDRTYLKALKSFGCEMLLYSSEICIRKIEISVSNRILLFSTKDFECLRSIEMERRG